MSGLRLRVVLALALVAAGLAASGCGGEQAAAVVPPKVEPALAPAELAGRLRLFENDDEATRNALANAGEDALMADGRVWELRDADRLVGTLQISTVHPRFDLADEGVREGMVSQVISGGPTRIRIEGVEVYSQVNADRGLFLWFGAEVYEILQIKHREIQFESLVAEIIRHQRTIPAWKPLPDAVGGLDEEERR